MQPTNVGCSNLLRNALQVRYDWETPPNIAGRGVACKGLFKKHKKLAIPHWNTQNKILEKTKNWKCSTKANNKNSILIADSEERDWFRMEAYFQMRKIVKIIP